MENGSGMTNFLQIVQFVTLDRIEEALNKLI